MLIRSEVKEMAGIDSFASNSLHALSYLIEITVTYMHIQSRLAKKLVKLKCHFTPLLFDFLRL